MDTLKELVKIVNRKRLSKIDVFDKTFLNQNNSNLYYQFYSGIEKGIIVSDESAAAHLYGINEKDAKYRKLKSRFKSKILKSILLFDVDELFNYELGKAYYECITQSHCIEILVKLTGTSNLVVELIKDNYPKALKYNFYDILKNYSYLLLTYYGLTGQKKLFQEEEERFYIYSDMLQKEQLAKLLYSKGIVEIVSSSSITNELLENVRVNVEKLEGLNKEINNPEIHFSYNYIALLYNEYKNDLHTVLSLCDDTDDLMQKHIQIASNNRKTIILIYRLKAYLQLKQFSKGLSLLKESSLILPEESKYNWFVVKENEFKLYLQDNKLQEAYKIYEQVLANPSYKRQVTELTEKWKIYHAYLVFMDNYLNKGDYKFNLAKFLNDVPVSSKDKSGYNFAVRVIEILFHAARKDYNLIFSKMDALRVYRSRYLNDNTYKRNHLFLSILLRAEKSGFNAREMQKADWPEIRELQKQNNYIIADWEIIPYEELWDIFCDLAKK